MKIYRKQIECITIIGPQEESAKAFEYCRKNGFHVIRSGPKDTGHSKYDVSKFKIIAEREVPRRPKYPPAAG